MLTRKSTAAEKAIAAIPFPVRLLTIAYLLTIMAFVGFGWIIFDDIRDAKIFTGRLARIEELSGIIVHLDEVLTTSARMAAATGDLRWEERYRRFEPQLDAANKEATKIGAGPSDLKAVTKTDEANLKLVEMENRAFALVRAGHKEEAQAVLFTPEYETQKEIYAEGITSLVKQLRREFDQSLQADERSDWLVIIAAMVSGGMTLVAWFGAARGMRRWRAHLLDSFYHRAEAEENLRRAHAELEVRVKERTADLAQTNETLQAEISERKRSEQALQESEARTRAIVESSLDCIVVIDHEGNILEFNPSAEKVFGYSRAEALGRELAQVIIPPSLRERHRQGMRHYLATGEARVMGKRIEITAIRSDGSEFPVELAITRVGTETPPTFTGFIRDISERKQGEEKLQESEERYRSLFEANPLPMWIYDLETLSFLEINDAAVSHYGYRREEFLAMTIADIRPADDKPLLLANVARVSEGIVDNAGVWMHRRKNGSIIDVEITSHVLDYGGRRAELVSACDITKRKLAEQALGAAEEKYRSIFENAAEGIYQSTPQRDFLTVNPAAARILGFSSPERLLAHTDRTSFGYVDPRRFEEFMRLVEGQNVVNGFESEVYRPDGSKVWVSENVRVARGSAGEILHFEGTIEDVTERKRIELALKESEELLRRVMDSSQDCIKILDLEGRLLWMNEGGQKIMEVDDFCLLQQQSWANLWPPDERTAALNALAIARGNGVGKFSGFCPTAKGSPRWWEVVVTPVMNNEGVPEKILSVSRDITDRRSAEVEVMESKRFLQSTLDALSSHIAILDEHGVIIEVNGAWNRFADENQSKNRLRGVGDNYLHLCDAARGPFSEEAPAMAAGIRAVIAGNTETFELEYPCHSPREERWFIARVTRFDGDGMVRVVVAHENISARKRAEEEVREAGGKLQSIIDSVEGIVWECDTTTGQVTFISRKAEEILGYSVSRWMEEAGFWRAHLHEDDREKTLALTVEAMAELRSVELEYRMVAADGREVWFRDKTSFIHTGGKPTVQRGLMIDITERKEIEQALQRQQSELRALFDLMPAMIWFKDTKNGILRVNKRVAEAAGKSVEEIEGKTSLEIYPQEAAGYYADDLEVIHSGTSKLGIVETLIGPEGQAYSVQTDKVPYCDKEGNVIGVVVMAQDITERKREEAEREVISEIVQGVMTTSNLDELLELAHRSISKLLYAENCFVGLHNAATDLIHFEFWVDKCDSVPPPQPIFRGFTRSSYVLRTGQPLLLTKELEGQLFEQGAIAKSGSASASWMGVPLRTPIRTIGVLAVQHYEKENVYSQRDLEFLSAVGDQIALAIERKQAEEELKRSEERLAAAQKMAHVGSWEWDVITNKVVWSDEEYRLFGLEPGEREPTHRFNLSLVHPDSRKDALRWFNSVRAMKKSSRMDMLIVRPDGQERILNSWADVVLDEAGNVIRVVGTSQDVTERENAERALAQSEERFRLVSRATDDAIWDWDVVANTISFSESLGTLFGYRTGEFESTMAFWSSSIHPDDHDEVMASVHGFFAGREEVWTGEYRFRCADGSYAFVYDRGYVVRDAEGKPLRMVGSMMNITERKRAEAELALSRLRLAEAQHIAQVGSWEWEVETDALTWSDEKYRLFGFAPNACAVTREFQLSCVLPEDRPAALAWIEAAIATGEPAQADFRIVRPDAEVRVMHTRVNGVFDENGKVIRILGTSQDITEQRRSESELRAAKVDAETANLAKGEFLANMSHEIRTPMNGIIGMTDLALETELNHDQREYLRMVKSSAHSLLGLINDILDFSKIEAGKLELEAIDFSLRDCIGGMLKPLGIRADQKGLELVADIHADVPDYLVGDSMRLRQILINLTDNAIKFTQRGEVVVGVSGQSIGNGESELQFCVSDTGIGIPEEKQAAIFEAFAQADGSTTRTYGGTGLGLSIASQLIQKMEGKIWIESKVGEGTTFHFTARFGVRAALSPVRRAEPHDLEGLRALVVDDNAVNRRVLSEMLQNWRMKPTAVESGATALEEMTRAANANAAYEVVLLDAMMPEMDGFALAEKINAQPALADATVMMLSSAMPAGTAERCDALGIAGWLSKPITQSELLDAILIAVSPEMEDRSSRGAEIQVAEGDLVKSGLRILVAEDNLINRAVATGVLEKAGHALVHVGTGREAVEAFSDGSFDLILMDVQMPEMDGFEATRRIRELEETTGSHITIVAMTAHAMAGDRERCLAAGMDDYVSKPLRKEDLLRALGGAIGEDRTETAPLYNREQLLSQCDGDADLMAQLVSIFHDNTPLILRAVGEAVEKGDAPALATQAHKLLSSLGVFGAGRARTLALRLERHAEENDFSGAKERFTELERETDKIYAAFA